MQETVGRFVHSFDLARPTQGSRLAARQPEAISSRHGIPIGTSRGLALLFA